MLESRTKRFFFKLLGGWSANKMKMIAFSCNISRNEIFESKNWLIALKCWYIENNNNNHYWFNLLQRSIVIGFLSSIPKKRGSKYLNTKQKYLRISSSAWNESPNLYFSSNSQFYAKNESVEIIQWVLNSIFFTQYHGTSPTIAFLPNGAE